jgi:hypothetical protein
MFDCVRPGNANEDSNCLMLGFHTTFTAFVLSPPLRCQGAGSVRATTSLKKTWACTLLGESTSPGPGGWGEDLPESALPVDSLLALDPFLAQDIERTACQLSILIHEAHTNVHVIKFKPGSKAQSLNIAYAPADRGLHLRNAGAQGSRAERSGSALF